MTYSVHTAVFNKHPHVSLSCTTVTRPKADGVPQRSGKRGSAEHSELGSGEETLNRGDRCASDGAKQRTGLQEPLPPQGLKGHGRVQGPGPSGGN